MRRLWSRNYRRIGSSLVVVVLTLFGLAAPAAAGDQVSFTATATAVVTGITRLPGGIIQIDQRVTGNATHLGDFTSTEPYFLDQQGNFTQAGCLGGANGKDSVCMALSGHNERTKGSCVGSSTGTYIVTGGTGAFANATGGGTLTAEFDECTGMNSATLTGTISQPNSG